MFTETKLLIKNDDDYTNFLENLLRKITLIIALAGVSGCAEMKVRRFQIDVDSISTPAANEKKRYLLLPRNKNIPHDDLQYLEFTRYIEKAMGEKGFARVGTPEESEVIVFFTYGIGNAENILVHIRFRISDKLVFPHLKLPELCRVLEECHYF